jgi:hypothetical protein
VPPSFCIFGDDLQRERGLAGGLGAVDFDHAAARQAADAQRDVEAQRPGGDDLDVLDDFAVAQAHDRALAELLLDLGERACRALAFSVLDVYTVPVQIIFVPLVGVAGVSCCDAASSARLSA